MVTYDLESRPERVPLVGFVSSLDPSFSEDGFGDDPLLSIKDRF